jgi:hypothetical protein
MASFQRRNPGRNGSQIIRRQDIIRTLVTCSQSNSSSVSQNSELVSSVKEVLSDFKKSMSDDLATISSRISSLEAGHRVSLPTPCEEACSVYWS